MNYELIERMLGHTPSDIQVKILERAVVRPTNRVILGTASPAGSGIEGRKALHRDWDELLAAGVLVDARLGRPGDDVVYRLADALLSAEDAPCPYCEGTGVRH